MGLWQSTIDINKLYNSFEMILNKSTLILVNENIVEPISKEDKNNYNFICSLIKYYQSLKNISYIKRKYSYFIISSKTKNISSYQTLNKSKEIFINWMKLLYKASKNDNDNFILGNKEKDNEYIKSEIIKNIKENKLLNIFIENFNKYYNNKNNKVFKKLILSGLPDFFRPIIWSIILEKNTSIKNRPSIKECLNQNYNTQNIKQIYKDIKRTFIINDEDNKDNMSTIDNIDDEKINKLKTVLIAVSNYNSDIGYTQGMNNIIGFLLKVTKFDVEKTFDLAILIMEKIKGYFTNDFPLLKEYLNLFNNEFKRRNNKLYKLFQKNDIPNELWISKWIQTLFTISFPYNEVCRIWDSLIVFGFDFIIYLSLAIVYYAEDELLKLNDSSDLINCLQEIIYPNPGIRKNLDSKSNYKDYSIPIYNIISRAKKIKRDILLEIELFNDFKKRKLNIDYYDYNENINYSNQCNIINSSKSRLISNSSFDNNTNNNILHSDLKSSSSGIISFNSSNNILKCLNQKNEKQSRNEISINTNNTNDNTNKNNLRKNSEISSEYSINSNLIKPKYISISRKHSDINDYKVYNINKLNNKHYISNVKTIFFNNNYFQKNINNNANLNYIQHKNFCYPGVNNINLNNNSKNFVNGRPRRNMKILIHKKNINRNVPLDNNQIIMNQRNYMSKSPDYFRLNQNYNINHNVNINMNNNIRYGYVQKKVIPINNSVAVNPQKRGSYNIPVPVKFYFGYNDATKQIN